MEEILLLLRKSHVRLHNFPISLGRIAILLPERNNSCK